MMLVSDMALLWNPAWRKWLEYYADEDKGEDRLSADFAIAFKRLTELGFLPSADEPAAFPYDPEAPSDEDSGIALEHANNTGRPMSSWGTSWGSCSRVRLGLEELDVLRYASPSFLRKSWLMLCGCRLCGSWHAGC